MEDEGRQILSDEAKRTWSSLLDGVEHHGEHVTVLRYSTPAAVIVPVDWYEQAIAEIGRGTS